jgi:hypothetical protein
MAIGSENLKLVDGIASSYPSPHLHTYYNRHRFFPLIKKRDLYCTIQYTIHAVSFSAHVPYNTINKNENKQKTAFYQFLMPDGEVLNF